MAGIIKSRTTFTSLKLYTHMSKQTTSSIIMVRPAAFSFNVETAVNNTFQSRPEEGKETVINRSIQEFDRLVETLRNEDVEVVVIQDSTIPFKPDAIFPNNWISFHDHGVVVTYPLFSPLRRAERRPEIIEEVGSKYVINEHYAMEAFEDSDQFLEGTGSMVLDRVNKIAYACLSPRTNPDVLNRWCEQMGYTPFTFIAKYDDQEVYHTNVMMSIGDGISIASLDVVELVKREAFRESLTSNGRELVELSRSQIGLFAGNMLAIRNRKGEQLMVMSASAFNSLDAAQKEVIQRHARIVFSDIETIESVGGGSVRCMIAENFLLHM